MISVIDYLKAKRNKTTEYSLGLCLVKDEGATIYYDDVRWLYEDYRKELKTFRPKLPR